MKTTELLIGMALVAFTATSSVQLATKGELVDHHFSADWNQSSKNHLTHLQIEPWMFDLNYWPWEGDLPEHLQTNIEQAMKLEAWMKSPFEAGVVEEDLFLEPWMSRF